MELGSMNKKPLKVKILENIWILFCLSLVCDTKRCGKHRKYFVLQSQKHWFCHFTDNGPVFLVFYIEFPKCHSETICTEGDFRLTEMSLVMVHLIALKVLQLLLMSVKDSE